MSTRLRVRFSAPVADVAPTISDQTFNINDGYTNGQTVGTVNLTNSPSPSASFSITAGNTNTAFAINSSTGVITVADETELVDGNDYSLSVQASNSAGSDTNAMTVNVSAAGAASLLFTLQLEKTDTSTVATGAIPQSVGLGFVDGDMPVGEWPTLKTSGGTEIPYTYWGMNTWPSGCMRMVKCLARIPEQITGTTGTLYDVEVWSGGSEPSSTTAVALSDAPDFHVDITGVTNLSGAWVSSLAQGRTDNDHVTILAQGPVGVYARVGQAFMQSGSDHGQLDDDHYVMILQDASGGVYGYRHISGWGQHSADVSSPTATYRQFSGVKKHGSTTIRTLSGIDHGDFTTVGSTITCNHYTGAFDAGTDAKMDFVAGTRAAEAQLRWIHDMAYWKTTGLLPPIDLSISVNPSASADYIPETKALFESWDMEASGERVEIAVWQSWNCRYLIDQVAVNERGMRVCGLVPSAWQSNLWVQATRKPVVVNNGPGGLGGNYTGLGTSRPTGWDFLGGGQKFGIVVPDAEATMWSGSQDTSHGGGSPSYAPWLFTGEWQYLDLMTRHSLMPVMMEQGGPDQVPDMPWGEITDPGPPIVRRELLWFSRHQLLDGVNYYGQASTNTQNLIRVSAWRMARLAHLSASLPDTDPAGTAIKDYCEDIVDASLAWINAFNAYQSAEWQDSGFLCFRASPSIEGGWTHGYYTGAVAQLVGATKKPAALTLLNHVGKLFGNFAARSSTFAQAITFHLRYHDEDGILIQDFDLMMGAWPGGTHTPNTGTNRYTVTNTFGTWTPTNGDRWSHFDSTLPSPIYYVVNAVGLTFQLSLTLGGSPLSLSGFPTVGNVYLETEHFTDVPSYETVVSHHAYIATVPAAIYWANAVGCTTLGDAVAKAQALQVGLDLDFDIDPKAALTTSFT